MSDVASQVPVLPLGEFRVGRVLSRAFEVLFHDFAKFVLLAVIAVLPYALLTFGGGAAAYIGPQARIHGALIGFAVLAFFVVFAFLTIISMAVTLYGAFQDMRGRTFNLGEGFARGLSRLFPLIGLGICWSVAITFGMVLLLVPGFMMLAAFYVALPACVMEGLGPLQSLSRSAALTKGHRWKVFGIYFLIAFANGIFAALVGFVFRLLIGPTGGAIASLVWNLLATAFNSIAIAVMYHDLRVLKDGIDIDRIAAVFD
jgi:hypothetical protein